MKHLFAALILGTFSFSAIAMFNCGEAAKRITLYSLIEETSGGTQTYNLIDAFRKADKFQIESEFIRATRPDNTTDISKMLINFETKASKDDVSYNWKVQTDINCKILSIKKI